jgi:hypothetical protein
MFFERWLLLLCVVIAPAPRGGNLMFVYKKDAK